MKNFYYISIVFFLLACQNNKPKENLENKEILPSINIYKGKSVNEHGINFCMIELSIGNKKLVIDSFAYNIDEEEYLAYYDLASSSKYSKSMFASFIDESKNGLVRKRYGKLVSSSIATQFATIAGPMLFDFALLRYCAFLKDSNLTITRTQYSTPSSAGIDIDTTNDDLFEVVYQGKVSDFLADKPKNKPNESISSPKENSESQKSERNSNSENHLSFSEIRGSIIMGSENTVIKVLGNPNDYMLAYDYATKIMHFKLGVIWMQRLCDYEVWVYDLPSNNRILVVFDRLNLRTNKVVKVIYSKDVSHPSDLIN